MAALQNLEMERWRQAIFGRSMGQSATLHPERTSPHVAAIPAAALDFSSPAPPLLGLATGASPTSRGPSTPALFAGGMEASAALRLSAAAAAIGQQRGTLTPLFAQQQQKVAAAAAAPPHHHSGTATLPLRPPAGAVARESKLPSVRPVPAAGHPVEAQSPWEQQLVDALPPKQLRQRGVVQHMLQESIPAPIAGTEPFAQHSHVRGYAIGEYGYAVIGESHLSQQLAEGLGGGEGGSYAAISRTGRQQEAFGRWQGLAKWLDETVELSMGAFGEKPMM
jgi:hypothetical protein